MANEEKKEQVTEPSLAQQDLERRQAEDYVPDAAVKTVTVNPNPFGYEAYAGTDPIYQNHANETEVPYESEDGPEKVAEEKVKELYSLDDVDEDDVVEDYGLGGKARRAGNPNVQPDRYLVPGQEGYPSDAEAKTGPLVRAADVKDSGSDEEEPVKEADFPETAVSAPVNPSSPPQKDADPSAKTDS